MSLLCTWHDGLMRWSYLIWSINWVLNEYKIKNKNHDLECARAERQKEAFGSKASDIYGEAELGNNPRNQASADGLNDI